MPRRDCNCSTESRTEVYCLRLNFNISKSLHCNLPNESSRALNWVAARMSTCASAESVDCVSLEIAAQALNHRIQTCVELRMVNMYWNTSRASVTAKRPNTQVKPSRGVKMKNDLRLFLNREKHNNAICFN